ncbi:MAG: hypothetical protein HYW01_06965 [Deltaproteobacteria bacterium]|nr:hypothetical protein [Deltaproteobacteria bacterium]
MKNKKNQNDESKQSLSEKELDETQLDPEKLYEDKLDEALANTFPASDPLPWTSDVRETATERKAGEEVGRKNLPENENNNEN